MRTPEAFIAFINSKLAVASSTMQIIPAYADGGVPKTDYATYAIIENTTDVQFREYKDHATDPEKFIKVYDVMEESKINFRIYSRDSASARSSYQELFDAITVAYREEYKELEYFLNGYQAKGSQTDLDNSNKTVYAVKFDIDLGYNNVSEEEVLYNEIIEVDINDGEEEVINE